MSSPQITAWAGTALMLLCMIMFWVFTLMGQQWLRPIMGRVRVWLLAMGMATVYGVAVIEPSTTVMLALLVVAVISSYVFRNQWVVARVAPQLRSGALSPGDEALVVVLPDNNAVTLAVVAKARTIAYNKLLLVHCGLSRSIALFEVDNPEHWYALIPHQSGFEISNGTGRWDGVDGSCLHGGEDLPRRVLGLCDYADWVRANPQATLLSIDDRVPPERSTRVMRLPGARKVSDAMDWGCVVNSDSWQPMEESRRVGGRFDYVLSRWAAVSRGLIKSS